MIQITGLKAPAETSESATNLTAIKTKPSTTPYRGPGELSISLSDLA